VSIPNKLEEAAQTGKDIVTSSAARMFGRNTVASTFTFLLDLLILWSLVEFAGLPHVPAAIIAFVVPMIVFYVLSREWVFPGTERGVAMGFVYFAVNIGIGFVVMLGVFWALLELTDIHYLIARVVASVVYGIVLFLLNGIFNFKQL
jgi:putative flippase GtrA